MIVEFKNFMTGAPFETRRLEYLKAINSGKIEPSSRFEKLSLIAADSDNRGDVKAARRLLEKYLKNYQF